MATLEGQRKETVSDKQVDYGTQLNDFTQKIDQITAALTDEPTENDDKAKIEGQELIQKFDDSFKEYLKKNPEQMQRLKDALKQSIQKIVDKFKKDNEGKIPDEFKPLLDFAKSIGIELQLEAGGDDGKNVPEFVLKNTDLQGIDSNAQDQDYFKGKDETVGINEKVEGQDSELDKTLGDIREQIKKIEAIDVSKISEDVKGKIQQIKQLLENINDVMGKKSTDNVKILQKFISENLSGDDKTKFDAKSYSTKYNEFDGKFGRGTLEGLNKVLEKTGSYIDSFKQGQTPENSNDVKAKDNNGQQPESKQQSESTQQAESKQQVQETQTPTSTEPLKFGSGESLKQYQVMQNSSDIAAKAGLNGITFYSTSPFTSPDVVGNGKDNQPKLAQSTSEIDGSEKEYYIKLSNNPDATYKVRVDKDGNLCPIAKEINNKLMDKKGESIEINALFSNNESCKKYLQNKLPDQIKDCKIGWDSSLQDYTLTSYGRTLTIEPMTIAGNWVSEDLSRSLAFLNLTNYIRNFGDQHGNIDPDVSGKLRIRGSKVNGKKVYIKKEEFGLKDATSDELSRFKKYNNREQWEDVWDKKKGNIGYKKIVVPDIKVQSVTPKAPTNPDTSTSAATKAPTNPDASTSAATKASTNPDTSTSAATKAPTNPDTSTSAATKAPTNPDTSTSAATKTPTNPDISTSAATKAPAGNQEVKDKGNEEIPLAELKKLGGFNVLKLGNFGKNGFVFKNGVEKSDSKGKFIEMNGLKIYELGDNENGVYYDRWKNVDGSSGFSFGQYRNGVGNGRRSDTFSDGDKYVGFYKNGNREGQGTYMFNYGARYTGGFKDGKYEGQGTHIYKDGSKYEGQYKNDKMEGQGTFTEDGIKYNGERKNDKIIKCTSYGNTISIKYDNNGKGYLETKSGKKLYFTDPDFPATKYEPYGTLANTINRIVNIVKYARAGNGPTLKLDKFEEDGGKVQADYEKYVRDTDLLSAEAVKKSTGVDAKTLVDWLNEYRKDVGI